MWSRVPEAVSSDHLHVSMKAYNAVGAGRGDSGSSTVSYTLHVPPGASLANSTTNFDVNSPTTVSHVSTTVEYTCIASELC